MRKYIYSICFMALSLAAEAKVKLPALLSDNMVLQRETTVNLWGEAAPNTKVRISCSWLNGSVVVKSDANGKWLGRVETPEAGGPHSITFDDGDKTTLNNVMSGDVWLCSGQSNMEMTLRGKVGQPTNGALDAILEAPSVKNIHFFRVEYNAPSEEVDYCNGEWKLPTCENVAKLSALAYYFANYVTTATGVPIGLLVDLKGGSSIIGWLSEESLSRTISAEAIAEMVGNETREDRHPSLLHNGLIKPIENCSFKGVLWYQGETNLDFPTYYKSLMCELVRSWREMWATDDNPLPFYFAQIAPNSYNSSEAIARPLFVEAQMEAEAMIDDCYMVTTTDLGDEVYNHAPQKDIIAQRFAALALKHSYGVDIDADYPTFEEVKYEDNIVYVHLTSTRGLCPFSIEGFEVAGEDQVFHKAIAEVLYKKAIVKVSSPNVEKPVAVRYAFRNYIKANMTNNLGIAAPSFRSDNW